MSCICGFDGTLLTNLGRWSGWTATVIDLDNPQRAVRTFGGDEGVARDMLFEGRRPDTYRAISRRK